MGTIVGRTRKNGSKAYLAQIAIRKNGAIVLRENRARIRSGSSTLADAIDRYVNHSVREIGRTKAQVQRSVKGVDIARKACPDITSADIFEFAQELAETRLP